jgi:hypothetical protein
MICARLPRGPRGAAGSAPPSSPRRHSAWRSLCGMRRSECRWVNSLATRTPFATQCRCRYLSMSASESFRCPTSSWLSVCRVEFAAIDSVSGGLHPLLEESRCTDDSGRLVAGSAPPRSALIRSLADVMRFRSASPCCSRDTQRRRHHIHTQYKIRRDSHPSERLDILRKLQRVLLHVNAACSLHLDTHGEDLALAVEDARLVGRNVAQQRHRLGQARRVTPFLPSPRSSRSSSLHPHPVSVSTSSSIRPWTPFTADCSSSNARPASTSGANNSSPLATPYPQARHHQHVPANAAAAETTSYQRAQPLLQLAVRRLRACPRLVLHKPDSRVHVHRMQPQKQRPPQPQRSQCVAGRRPQERRAPESREPVAQQLHVRAQSSVNRDFSRE